MPLDLTGAARPIISGFALCRCEKCGAEAYLPEGYAPELAGWEYDETKPKCGNHIGTYYMHRVGGEFRASLVMSARYLSPCELAEAGLMMRLFSEGQASGLDVERMMRYAKWWNSGSSIAQVDKRRASIKAWALKCLRDYVVGARA